MKYVSTRSGAPPCGFEEAMLAGLAPDGGLYLPQSWPQLDLRALRGRSYQHVAEQVIAPFIGDDVPENDLRRMIGAAYATFGHAAVVPLRQLDANLWQLDLFHGPTLAFKDVAMQLLARLIDHALERRNSTATIVCATSGDTGAAAAHAFKESQRATTVILHPKGRVSDVQRRQMTTVDSDVIHNIAIDGTFDDCQAIVKTLFRDHAFAGKVRLSGVNSINWARIVAQAVYYVTAALSLGAPERTVSFCVPTGNFGDIFAGLVAKRMGLPIDRLVVATNANDILDRTLKTGRYEVQGVVPSISPSMDIQVSSNFERLLYLASDKDGAAVRRMMESLSQSGAFTVPEMVLAAIGREFSSGSASAAETLATIRRFQERDGEIVDPHTAVGLYVAEKHQQTATPMVALATAHAAKFPEAVSQATGVYPELPHRLSHLLKAPERFTVLPNSVGAVRDYILAQNKA
jgi:threonine synthase